MFGHPSIIKFISFKCFFFLLLTSIFQSKKATYGRSHCQIAVDCGSYAMPEISSEIRCFILSWDWNYGHIWKSYICDKNNIHRVSALQKLEMLQDFYIWGFCLSVLSTEIRYIFDRNKTLHVIIKFVISLIWICQSFSLKCCRNFIVVYLAL